MTFNYRRTSLDRDTTFYIPKVECFACNDSGIVSNGDALINQFIPDYDRDKKGRPCGGQDLAIICHCKAAYGDSHSDNEKERVGFRDSYGNIRTTDSITRTSSRPAAFAPSIVPLPANTRPSSSITIDLAAPYFFKDSSISEADRSVLFLAFLWSGFRSLSLVIWFCHCL